MSKDKAIRIMTAKIPVILDHIEDFLLYAQYYLDEEMPIAQVELKDQQVSGQDFSKIEIKQSTLESCTFHDCEFGKSSFADVVFRNCDFSGNTFFDACFDRCQFISCKCIGCNMSGSVFKHTLIHSSNWQYSYFDRTKLTNVALLDVDFTEVSVSEAVLKNFEAKNTRFIKNNFFKTLLSGISFTENEFLLPTVSSPPVELQGIKINPFQAADLISLWGIVVEM